MSFVNTRNKIGFVIKNDLLVFMYFKYYCYDYTVYDFVYVLTYKYLLYIIYIVI